METGLDDLSVDLFQSWNVLAFGEEPERWVVLEEPVRRIGRGGGG